MDYRRYKRYLGSRDWKQRRARKMGSISGCEEPGCHEKPREAHHGSYKNLGHEDDHELKGLCSRHHKKKKKFKKKFDRIMELR